MTSSSVRSSELLHPNPLLVLSSKSCADRKAFGVVGGGATIGRTNPVSKRTGTARITTARLQHPFLRRSNTLIPLYASFASLEHILIRRGRWVQW